MGSVEIKVTNKNFGHGYTGLFGTGGDSCLIRLSVVFNPKNFCIIPSLELHCRMATHECQFDIRPSMQRKEI